MWWLTHNTILAGLMALVLLLVNRRLRIRPSVCHVLWLAVLVRLIVPPVISWPWAVSESAFSWRTSDTAQERNEAANEWREQSSDLALILPEVVLKEETANTSMEQGQLSDDNSGEPAAVSAAAAEAGWTVAGLALLAWLAGVSVMVLVQTTRVVRFRRLLAVAQAAPLDLQSLIAHVAGRLGLRTPVTLVVSGIASPMIWCLGRTKLLWPARVLDDLDQAAAGSVISHELAHMRRLDHWVCRLLWLLDCLWWWNPVYWLVRRRIQIEAELACDAWAIETFPEARRAYAEALISVTQILARRPAPGPALGMGSGARHTFERRLVMIMGQRVPCRIPMLGLVALGLLAAATVPGWAQVQVLVKKPEEPAQKEAKSPVQKGDVLLYVEDSESKSKDVKPLHRKIEVTLQPSDKFAEDVLVVRPSHGAASDSDKRLQDVEQQLQKLLKEVQSLRAGSAKAHVAVHPRMAFAPQKIDPAGKVIRSVVVVTDGDHAMSLSRATYRLSGGRAETLAALLKELVRTPVLELKIEGDKLTVTTTPDAQKAIGGLVKLIEGQKSASWDARKPKAEHGLHLELKLPDEAIKIEPALRARILRDEVIQKEGKKDEKKSDVIRKLEIQRKD